MRKLYLVILIIAAHTRLVAGAEPARDFSHWEKEIAAFEKQDAANPPPKGVLLFTGSSTIRNWKTLARDFPNQRVLNRGFGGSQIIDATHFADRIIFPYEPRLILLRAGSNDLWAGKAPEQVFADFQDFVAAIRTRLPDTEIVFISLNPTPARWKQTDKEKILNSLVEQFVRQTPHLQYIDTYPMTLGDDGKPRTDLFVADQLHFNAAGYKLFAERVRPFLPK